MSTRLPVAQEYMWQAGPAPLKQLLKMSLKLDEKTEAVYSKTHQTILRDALNCYVANINIYIYLARKLGTGVTCVRQSTLLDVKTIDRHNIPYHWVLAAALKGQRTIIPHSDEYKKTASGDIVNYVARLETLVLELEKAEAVLWQAFDNVRSKHYKSACLHNAHAAMAAWVSVIVPELKINPEKELVPTEKEVVRNLIPEAINYIRGIYNKMQIIRMGKYDPTDVYFSVY